MPITLHNQTSQGVPLTATFSPEQGLALLSYKRGDIEVIAQATRAGFEERFAGLGPLIGPHFHRRHPGSVPKVKQEELFPHIARVKALGISDPFSHGISRYAPWKVESDNKSLKGILCGKDEWNGVLLKALEGQDFRLQFSARLETNGLFLDFSVVSETDSIVGIHYYYDLPDSEGEVRSFVQDRYIAEGVKAKLEGNFNFTSNKELIFDLKTNAADYTFYPFPNPLQGNIRLKTKNYQLHTTYNCKSQENAWQLYHPKDAQFVCIEPVSAQDPRHPNLSVSEIQIQLEIMANP